MVSGSRMWLTKVGMDMEKGGVWWCWMEKGSTTFISHKSSKSASQQVIFWSWNQCIINLDTCSFLFHWFVCFIHFASWTITSMICLKLYLRETMKEQITWTWIEMAHKLGLKLVNWWASKIATWASIGLLVCVDEIGC